ncbi:hypothetical protein [Gordonia soli]|uniref:Uncharacterized protein n=1 Tax=Gordonia soli NBRC 108243 TaxID=1223545 RepID=M0QKR6_9ACTN|nr:hypothetical protein [Gordonia soli]GAC69235.1 hypothetical protein GS4_23_00290 [Gordonia soli NBRC 108243]
MRSFDPASCRLQPSDAPLIDEIRWRHGFSGSKVLPSALPDRPTAHTPRTALRASRVRVVIGLLLAQTAAILAMAVPMLVHTDTSTAPAHRPSTTGQMHDASRPAADDSTTRPR